MKYFQKLLLLSLVIFIQSLSGQYFGKNKVQYKNFQWRFIQSEHFDVYFYEGGQKLAEFTAEAAEEAYQQISRNWKFQIRNRIVWVIYKSHNDWQQTNVVISYLEEGIGGVTELYKNRIVVPFEGSYNQFRHVIHHELTHAVMNDMLYGGTVQSLVMGEVTPAPLWFSEGLAEFQSQGWNTQLDMIVRDAVLHNYMPELRFLEYFLVYQGGASVFRYIAQTYGRDKIGEMLHKMRGRAGFGAVLQSTLGLSYEEFTQKWHKYLKKQYWPDIADQAEPFEISNRLTNHKKEDNYLNVSPAVSPNGDKIAFISDRKGYQNIYLMSALDGKIIKTLVKGQRSESFEELHFLRPGISFSPDGKRISLSAKSGQWDAIYTVDIKNGKTKKYKLKLDGIFTTAWSPDGENIAFVGNHDEKSDLYIYNIFTGDLTQLTNDVFSDDQPSWSPDGRRIAFVSDRKQFTDTSAVPPNFRMSRFNFEKRDVYIIDVQTHQIERVTETPWDESNPIFSPDGEKLAYTSDRNGIFNLYIHNLRSGDAYPVTNIISGIYQSNWDRNANKLVYTTFYNGGFDIYTLYSPLELDSVQLKDTRFMKEMKGDRLPVYARNWEPGRKLSKKIQDSDEESADDFGKYVFGMNRVRRTTPQKDVSLSPEIYQTESGEYKVRRYKLRFTPDIIAGNAGYNTYFGLQGFTTMAFSDLMGDHKIFLNINLLSDIKNSNISMVYFYLKRRINYGLGGYHQAYFFLDNFNGLIRYRNFGTVFIFSYPISKFKRIDMNLQWFNVFLEYLDQPIPTQKVSTFLPSLSYVYDDVIWGYTGPVDGKRYSLEATMSPKYDNKSLDFQTFKLDYRKYFMLNREYQFAFRLAAGASFGKNPQHFFLGGIDNWINRKFRGRRRFYSIEDVFFSEFVTPLRGALYYEREGTRYFLSNFEFRFPLIKYLGLGFPPISLFNIRGVLFYDIGGAFSDFSKFQFTRRLPDGNPAFQDVISGFGGGARIFFLYFLMRFDIAWRYDLNRVSKPVFYWSLGADL